MELGRVHVVQQLIYRLESRVPIPLGQELHLLIYVPLQTYGTGGAHKVQQLGYRVQGSNPGGARAAPVDKCTFVV